jgi:transcriptional regulator with GAF, ATPase, and Fis domain
MNIASLQPIATAIACERNVRDVLKMIVNGLVDQHRVALARIWLLDKGDICATCRMRNECLNQEVCLHLAASAGFPRHSNEDWSRLDGEFQRFPVNARKVGRIAATGEPMLLNDVLKNDQWIMHSEWAKREGINSFAGQPLIFRREKLGVLVIFTREPFPEEDMVCLRSFADHAAVAIANARAFEEIERLKERLELENRYLREEINAQFALGNIIGESAAMKKLLRQIQMVAPTDANVLIQGESGTGKELIARAIYENSLRSHRPFIKVNCASVPRELFESEFFGHTKGSFTGAIRDRAGRFQLADGGTLFLDEVGEIPLELQSKLLRVLQEGEFERIGDEHSRRVDVRVIAATNRDVKREIVEGRFREDLYYRLSVFPVEAPPLRDRKDDIGLLASHFLQQSCRRLNCMAKLTEHDVKILQSYNWRGNVRELQHVIERAAILSQGGRLRFEGILNSNSDKLIVDRVMEETRIEKPLLTKEEMKQRERQNIIAALEKSNGKIYGAEGAAELLNMKPTTLASRMKVLNIQKSENR